MYTKYSPIVFAGCCHLVASQTATSWPPSASVPAAISKVGLVAACSGTAVPPQGAGTLPPNLFSGIQADLNNQNSEISQMIQATCNKEYASQHQQYGSCNGNVCTFAASTPEYTASYTTNTVSGNLDFCLGAPVCRWIRTSSLVVFARSLTQNQTIVLYSPTLLHSLREFRQPGRRLVRQQLQRRGQRKLPELHLRH